MDKIWWEQVTKANLFIANIVEKIRMEINVMLMLPNYVPWRDELRSIIKAKVTMHNSKKILEFIESPGEKVGEFLLNKYCKEEKRLQYRRNKSYACFLAESSDIVLNDRYVWVRNIPRHLFDEWADLVSDYYRNRSREKPAAVFILEISDENIRQANKKGIERIFYNTAMNLFDTYTFCTLAVSGLSCKLSLKNYLAELVSNICEGDVELCAKCINRSERFLADPAGEILAVRSEEVRSDGSAFIFDADQSVINKRIWKTQIKMIFPIIEDYRGNFVEKYYTEIIGHLPMQNSCGAEITRPEEIEIGTLNFMVDTGRFVISLSEGKKLYQFKEARNTLAHLKILSLIEIDAILA